MKIFILAAACSLVGSNAVEAAVALHLDADVPLTVTTDHVSDFSSPDCVSVAGHCLITTTTSFIINTDYVIAPENIADGETFSFSAIQGDPHYGISGLATYLGKGIFQPINLTVSYAPTGTMTSGFGRTTDFTLTDRNMPPVPEPATWATMLLGMFGIASSLRYRGRKAGFKPLSA